MNSRLQRKSIGSRRKARVLRAFVLLCKRMDRGIENQDEITFELFLGIIEYTPNSHQYIHAMELEANRAQIKDLRIQRLTTTRGDIAYSWQLQDGDSAGRYEEGDVVGIFPDKIRPSDQTYLDLLTPDNYKEAILAGVITRSYYIAANSQEGIDLVYHSRCGQS